MNSTGFRDYLDHLKRKLDIVEIIGEHIDLDRHYRARCPFHDDTNPSFSVNATGQFFYCFGCGAGGDVIAFQQRVKNQSFWEAVTELARRVGMELPAHNSKSLEQIEHERKLSDVLNAAVEFYAKRITDEARTYLVDERGFSEEVIERSRIGYAGGGLKEHLIEERGYAADLCVEAGVLKRNSDGSERDFFRDRVIFPNFRHGRVVHLTGRSIDGQEPKYLHLPGEIRHLYNEDAAHKKRVLIAEGAVDCISAIQAGFDAVGILGCSGFKPEFASKFKRCEEVIICMDGDEPGRRAALKIAENIGDRARIVQMPDGSDINSFLLEHTKEEFSDLVERAPDAIRYQLDLIPPDIDKVQLHGMLKPTLAQLANIDPVKSVAYLLHVIKPQFNLTNPEIDAYCRSVKQIRDDKAENQEKVSSDKPSESTLSARFAGLVDLVEQDGQSAFLILEDGELKVIDQVEREGIIHEPPPKQKIPWLLPRAKEVLEYDDLQKSLTQANRDRALFNDLVSNLKSASELPNEGYYDLLAAWVMHTYLLETTQYSPIICLYAVPERGKSRTGKALIYLSYRGFHVESLRDAYLIRVASNFCSSLFFDVKDIWRKAEKNGSEDMLLLRFEKGARVPRVNKPDKGPFEDTDYYEVFGPTIIATNESVHKILETRAIQINMPETTRRFENDVTPEVFLPLKERLLAFRARHLGEQLTDIAKPARGRLGDILKPILQLIRLVRPDREAAFLRLVRELESDRLADKSESMEARILAAICRCESQVEQGKLTVSQITEEFNVGVQEKYRSNSGSIGRRLNAMGFKKTRVADGKMAMVWNDEMIERLRVSHGLETSSETSDTSNLMGDTDFRSEDDHEDSEEQVSIAI